jgi:hypothetical protein
MHIRSSARTLSTLACCTFALCSAVCGAAIAADDGTHYQIVSGESELRILVFRTGSLARLGHNHVVSTRALQGTAVTGGSSARPTIDLRIPVDSFVVDDPVIRTEEGMAFSAEVNDKDISGTRANMLGPKLLQADEFDEIRIISDRISGAIPDLTVHAVITLKGAERAVDLPVIVELYDDRLVASGTTEISHSELGLSPFRAAFGALRVAENLTFKYYVVARKSHGDDQS